MPAKQVDGIMAAQVEQLQSSVSWLRLISLALAIISLLLITAVIILWNRTYDLQIKTTKVQGNIELKDGSVTNSKVADNAIAFSQLSPALQNQINNLNQITLNPIPGPAGANGAAGVSGTNGSNGSTGPAGPAGGVTGVQNGLSLVGTLAELGGSPLLHDTSLTQDGNDLILDATGAGGNFVSLGEYGAGTALTTSGPGTRQIWYPKKSALRSGTIDTTPMDLNTFLGPVGLPTYTGDQWDDVNIGDFSTAFGFDTVASGMYSTSIGGASIASGTLSGSLGVYNAVTGDYSLAIGGFNYVEGDRNVVIGLADIGIGGCGMNSVISNNNFVVGCSNSIPGPGDLQTILGQGNISVGSGNFIAGNINEAYNGQIMIVGVDNTVYSSDSMAIGSQNYVDDTFGTPGLDYGFVGAVGRLNTVDGYQSMAVGYNNAISGMNSFAAGYDNAISGMNSFVIGRNAAVNNDYSLSINLDDTNFVGMDVTGDHSIGINMGTNPYTLAASNTMAIMGGDVGINTLAPAGKLDVDGTTFLRTPTASVAGDEAVCRDPITLEIRINAAGTTCAVSSERFKHNIQDLGIGLDFVNDLHPVSYERNSDNTAEIGFIAEEVAALDSRLIFYEKDGITPRGVKYEQMTAVLANAVKEQDGKVENINKVLSDQGIQITNLSEELKALATRVDRNTSEIELLKAENTDIQQRLKALEGKVNQVPAQP